MSEELKPCPFCGNDDEYLGFSFDHSVRSGSDSRLIYFSNVSCNSCDASVSADEGDYSVSGSKQIIIERWNTRHIPEGYALVPIEPTREMREAFHDSYEDYENGDASCPDAQWKAMIAAAQDRPE